MTVARVAPIVEGHGDASAVRVLLPRIWRELLGGELLQVLSPIRVPRSRLVAKPHLRSAVELALGKLACPDRPDEFGFISILLDADDDSACVLGPRLLSDASEGHANLNISCVVAVKEFETWFVGAASSLKELLAVEAIPTDPEGSRRGAKWIEERFRGTRYSKTVDQPRMCDRMDLSLCRGCCPSFDKLCRDLEAMKRRADALNAPD